MLSLGKDYASFPLGVSRFPDELNSRYNPYIARIWITTHKTTALFAQSEYLKHNLSSRKKKKESGAFSWSAAGLKSVEVSCSSLAVYYSFNNQYIQYPFYTLGRLPRYSVFGTPPVNGIAYSTKASVTPLPSALINSSGIDFVFSATFLVLCGILDCVVFPAAEAFYGDRAADFLHSELHSILPHCRASLASTADCRPAKLLCRYPNVSARTRFIFSLSLTCAAKKSARAPVPESCIFPCASVSASFG